MGRSAENSPLFLHSRSLRAATDFLAVVLRPRNGAWARRLRAGHKGRADTNPLRAANTSRVESTAATTDAAKANSYHADYRGRRFAVHATGSPTVLLVDDLQALKVQMEA